MLGPSETWVTQHKVSLVTQPRTTYWWILKKCYLLWPLVDGAQFGQQTEEAAILYLLQTNNWFIFSSPKHAFILFIFSFHFCLYWTVRIEEAGNKIWHATQLCCLNYLPGASSSSSWVENEHSASIFWVGSQNRYRWGLVRLNHSWLLWFWFFTNAVIQRKQCSALCWYCRLRKQTSKWMKKNKWIINQWIKDQLSKNWSN